MARVRLLLKQPGEITSLSAVVNCFYFETQRVNNPQPKRPFSPAMAV
jgi:hypothetical protein